MSDERMSLGESQTHTDTPPYYYRPPKIAFSFSHSGSYYHVGSATATRYSVAIQSCQSLRVHTAGFRNLHIRLQNTA